MKFSKALKALKESKRVVRTGWKGGEAYVQLYRTSAVILEDDELVVRKVNPFLLIGVAGEDNLSVYQPTSCDVLAEDWKIVD